MSAATQGVESEYSLRQNFGWLSVSVRKQHLSTRAGVIAFLRSPTVYRRVCGRKIAATLAGARATTSGQSQIGRDDKEG